jgi:6-phosphogluconolactonase (cycloisomerase 2 family)
VGIYRLDSDQKPRLVQTLKNPRAELSIPQHALFFRNEEKLAVANWLEPSLLIYTKSKENYREKPTHKFSFPTTLSNAKPHGMAFSPCGQILAIAFGASAQFDKAIGLFQITSNQLLTLSLVKDSALPGPPKGICFTPDGSHLLVSFADPSQLALFSVQNQVIDPLPVQIIEGPATRLSRPEDVKISSEGNYCAVSNSDQDTITFYAIKENRLDPLPFASLENPASQLQFPHGLSFSADGNYLAITQFGPIYVTPEGNVLWDLKLSAKTARINLYDVHGFSEKN